MKEHILSVVWLTPIIGMFLLLLIPREKKQLIRYAANIVGFIGFLVSLPLVFWFDKADGNFQFRERLSWIPSLGVEYHLGIDGISLLLIMLTTVVGFLATLSSWSAIQDRVKEYYAFLLFLQAGMLGVFMALDLFPQMISVGESTGALDIMLNKIADFYEDEVDQAVENLTSMMEPMIMVFLGVVVGGFVVAMYMPIFSMASNIHVRRYSALPVRQRQSLRATAVGLGGEGQGTQCPALGGGRAPGMPRGNLTENLFFT